MKEFLSNFFTLILIAIIVLIMVVVGFIYQKCVVKGENLFGKTEETSTTAIEEPIMLSAEEETEETIEIPDSRPYYNLSNYIISGSERYATVFNAMLDTICNKNCIKQYSYRDGNLIKEAIMDLNYTIRYRKDSDNNNNIVIDQIKDNVWYRYSGSDYNNLEKKVYKTEDVDTNELLDEFMELAMISNTDNFNYSIVEQAYCDDEECYKIVAENKKSSNAMIKQEFYINKENYDLLKVEKTYKTYVYTINFVYTNDKVEIGNGLLDYEISK